MKNHSMRMGTRIILLGGECTNVVKGTRSETPSIHLTSGIRAVG